MNKLFGPNSPLGQVFACLLLATFVFIGLIPTGFMPDIGKKSGSFITICSGLETRQIKLDDQTGDTIPAYEWQACGFTVNPSMSADIAMPLIRPPLPESMPDAPAPDHTDPATHAFSQSAPRAPPAA